MIADRIRTVLDEIREAERLSGRAEQSVKLMAVSKFHPAAAVREAADCGQLLFGENRVKEASAKFAEVRAAYPNAELHIIGSLQRNKVKEAVRISDCIQSFDRIELAQSIESALAASDRRISVLIEYRTGEDTKSGFTSADAVFRAADFVLEHCPHISLDGFMTMAPFTDDESEIRRAFRRLVSLAESMRLRFPCCPLKELSMGMSNDFKIAVEEGSTLVRIGTAIFGSRSAG